MERRFLLLLIVLPVILSGCQSTSPDSLPLLGLGFRFSTYGPSYNPGPEYWAGVGKELSGEIKNATPQAIWIVGNIFGEGTYLNFPCKSDDPYIKCGFMDMNEAYFNLFDERGIDVWLQVEPGDANLNELISITLGQYSHHPCVIGFGIDVEWYHSTDGPLGVPVTDAEATQWLREIRKHNKDYYLFLKHWEIAWMPPKAREGIVFINDEQNFDSLDQMKESFSNWGKHFSPYPVGFQFGYYSDRSWWKKYPEPARAISHAILENIPNARSLFWVDFTIFEVFPPD